MGIVKKLERGINTDRDQILPNGNKQIVSKTIEFTKSIDNMVSMILYNIDEQVSLIEFRDLQEKILQQFEDSN